MDKAIAILETLLPVNFHKEIFTLLFDVVNKSEDIGMIPSKSGNFPVSNTKQLESDESVAKLISAVKNVSGVSIMTNQSNDYDTPLLSIVPSGSTVTSKEKKALFAKYM